MTQSDIKVTSASSTAKASEKKENRKLRSGKTKPTGGKTPVIRYDSSTKKLELHRSVTLDGKTYNGDLHSIDLSSLDEKSRQLVIASFKIAIAYANGNDISASRPVKDKDALPSLLSNFQSLVSRKVDGNLPKVIPSA